MRLSEASTLATDVDHVFFALLAVCSVLALSVFTAMVYFGIKYRAGKKNWKIAKNSQRTKIEIVWASGLLIFVMIIFAWSGRLYFKMYVPPKGATEVYVVGKQWMWKFFRPGSPAAAPSNEIDTLHVPLGRPVKLIMTSEDVIHSLFIPEFRVKQDVLPGRYTSLWFEATRLGKFRILCTQYCGMDHARMTGWVEVMKPDDYDRWLQTREPSLIPASTNTKMNEGEALYHKLQCASCHDKKSEGGMPVAPDLHGVFGAKVALSDGTVVDADENYIRESIVSPGTKAVRGFKTVMPSYQGLLSSEDLLSLTAYVKSLSLAREARR